MDDTVSANIKPHIPKCLKFIQENKTNNKSVLVYCRQGVSRSATIVISYLINRCNISYETALKYVKERRSKAQPNKGFVEQLKNYKIKKIFE